MWLSNSSVDEPLRQSFQVLVKFGWSGELQKTLVKLFILKEENVGLLIFFNLFQNMHGGYPEATLERFLKARDEDVTKAGKMVSTN